MKIIKIEKELTGWAKKQLLKARKQKEESYISLNKLITKKSWRI